MKISFHGAARTVTGSKHLISFTNSKKILLDCGMFQGMGAETLTYNQTFGFDPKEIDYVILSHAHIDHSGLLPKLVKEGFSGPIFCTEATFSLAKILLLDSAHIQEADVQYANKIKNLKGKPSVKPLYTEQDAYNVFPLFHTIKYNEWFSIDDSIELLFTDAGHIIGSACVHLVLKENNQKTRITFSGDLGRYSRTLLKSPEPFPQADYIILESTYGNQLHPPAETATESLFEEIERTCIQKGGKLIIPAFSLGRTQELLYALNQLQLERRLPPVSYYVDSPMSVAITQTFKAYPHLFNSRVQDVLKKDDDPFDFPRLTMIKEVEVSKALNFSKDPCVIISASGMAEAGRVKHHIANNIEDAKNTILLVGYCEPNSLGGRLKLMPEEVGIFGQPFKVRADIKEIKNLSAHGDYQDMSNWLSCQNPKEVKQVFLVHGEYDVQQEFANKLIKKGFTDVQIPSIHQEIGLGH